MTAVCNIVGEITKSLVVGSPERTIPGFNFLGIISLIILLTILGTILMKIRRSN